jgi:pilus assembly protein Flp/PilA
MLDRSMRLFQASFHVTPDFPKGLQVPMATGSSSIDSIPSSTARPDQHGQGMVEYALIIVLVAIGVVVAITAFGTQLQTVFNTIVNNLSSIS